MPYQLGHFPMDEGLSLPSSLDPKRLSLWMVDHAGIEPAVSCLQGRCLPVEAYGPKWRCVGVTIPSSPA